MAKGKTVSAQVVFRPASGRKLDRGAAITAENIAEYRPRPDSVEAAARLFSDQGFQVAPLVGNSFSITAPPKVFVKAFGLQLSEWGAKGMMFIDKMGHARHELPRSHLPKRFRHRGSDHLSLRRLISARRSYAVDRRHHRECPPVAWPWKLPGGGRAAGQCAGKEWPGADRIEAARR